MAGRDCTDLLIFDDMCFDDWEPEQAIHLLDMNNVRSIKTCYVDATIPKGMSRIFTTNTNTIFPNGKNEEQQKAIDRRHVRVGPVQESLFPQLSDGERLTRMLVKQVMKHVVKTPLLQC